MVNPDGSVARRVNAIRAVSAGLRSLCARHGRSGLDDDDVARFAFERLLQRVSDASRGLPDQWKVARPDIRWGTIAELGDTICTQYDRLDLDSLWDIYQTDIEPLEAALVAMISDAAGRKPTPC